MIQAPRLRGFALALALITLEKTLKTVRVRARVKRGEIIIWQGFRGCLCS